MLKCAAVALLALATVASSSIDAAKLSPVVTIGQGKLQGLEGENAPGVYSFKNVPFAQPPVGELRFADPVSPKPWSGTLNATAFGPGCPTIYSPESFPQKFMIPKTMSEDCLQLNVYTPSLSTSTKLPVAVFFYGGNYNLGSGAVPLYDGSALAAAAEAEFGIKGQNMVIVTINYRLNILGGLFAGGEIQGNFNYKDQLQSLKWCKENIAAFGGNPSNVMIWGQSAGAASVTSHMIAPMSWPYFTSALSLSNPIGLQFQTPELALKIAEECVKNVSCPFDGSLEMVKCLRAVPVDKLVAVALNKPQMIPNMLPKDVAMILMPWVPVVDGNVIPNQPIRALASGSFNKVPFVISTVANESNEFTRDVDQKNLSKIEAELLMDLIFANHTLSKSVLSHYFPNGMPDSPDYHLLIDPIVTDWLWWAPWTTVGQLMSALTPGKIFQVMFTAFLKNWDDWIYSKPINWYCRTAHTPGYKPPVCHADDLSGYWAPIRAIKNAGYKVPASTMPNPGEIALVKQMQGMLGSLARSGHPGTEFPPMTPPNTPARFYNFSASASKLESHIVTDFRKGNVDFWKREGLIHY